MQPKVFTSCAVKFQIIDGQNTYGSNKSPEIDQNAISEIL